MISCDFVCQNCNPSFCARDNFYSVNGILITFPMTVIVHFLKNCVIITGFFSTRWIKWCEEDNRSSLVAFLSTQSETVLEDRLNAVRTTPVIIYFFQL